MKKIVFFTAFVLVASISFGQVSDVKGGWKQIKYEFIDGTQTVERVLAGTSSYMDEITKYKGAKGNVEINFNRYDRKSGDLIAGVNYNVIWTDPQKQLFPGDKIKMNYALKTISSKTWTPNQQSVSFNQGIYGLYLLNASGENYFSKDFSSEILSSKPVEKGYKPNEEKSVTVNMGSGFKAVYTYVWDENLTRSQITEEPTIIIPVSEKKTGWYFTDYSFVDGTTTVERVLAGTSSYMDDITKYKGGKGDIEIYFNRYDRKTGDLLAGVNYSVKWTDPQTVLYPGDKISMKYSLKTISSKSWTPAQQSVSFNQGIYGLYLLNTDGDNYFSKDFSAQIISSKPVDKGYNANEKKAITVNLGSGFKAIYNYEWRVF